MNDLNFFKEELADVAGMFRELILPSIDQDKMDEFANIIAELMIAADSYDGHFEHLLQAAEENKKRTEYGIASKYVHRGYYCPSPITDLIIGNSHRGKLTKSIRSDTKDYFTYIFDEHNHMICAEHRMRVSKDDVPANHEFIIRDENVEFGITFTDNLNKEISFLSQAIYHDGLIRSYSSAIFNAIMQFPMTSLDHEEYFYSDGILQRADVYMGIIPAINSYDKSSYTFNHDDKGIIIGYTESREFQGVMVENSFHVPKNKKIVRKFS